MGKLVRDKIPDIIRADGLEPNTRVLGINESVQALGEKAIEEAREFRSAELKEDKLEELADLQEVIDASVRALGYTERRSATSTDEKKRSAWRVRRKDIPKKCRLSQTFAPIRRCCELAKSVILITNTVHILLKAKKMANY